MMLVLNVVEQVAPTPVLTDICCSYKVVPLASLVFLLLFLFFFFFLCFVFFKMRMRNVTEKPQSVNSSALKMSTTTTTNKMTDFKINK